MSTLVAVGSIAYDSLETPFGRRDRALGGSAVHFSLAARLFTEVGVVGVVGVSNLTDFLRSHASGRVDIVGTPVFVGRSQQVWAVEITRASDGKLVSRGQVRFQNLTTLPADR